MHGCRSGSTGGDAAGDALATKEPSALLGQLGRKLRPSQSERELPTLIASHPEGGEHAPTLLPFGPLLANVCIGRQ